MPLFIVPATLGDVDTYIHICAQVIASGAEEGTVRKMLTDMGFGVSRTAAAIEAGVGTLSGGWRMKVGDRSSTNTRRHAT